LIRVRTSGDLTGIRDPHRLRQLIANLLGNALEHGSSSDPVDLTAHDLLTGASPHKNENLVARRLRSVPYLPVAP